jgi:hypothetical protein
MTAYVEEFSWPGGASGMFAGLTRTPLASYSLSTSAPSTGAILNAAADYVRVSVDQGSYVGFTLSTVSTATFLTSTNAHRMPANTVENFAVPQGIAGLRIASHST